MAGIEVNRRTGNLRRAQIGAAAAVLLSLAAGGWTPAAASGPNIVEQWNKIAEDTVVATGAFQIEGFVYMSYTQTAVYDALVAIDGTYQSFGPAIAAPAGASREAAVVEAAYETLAFYIPSAAGPLGTARDDVARSDRPTDSRRPTGSRSDTRPPRTSSPCGRATAARRRSRSTSSFPTKTPGPGVWRLTPPYLAPQTPWAGVMKPFVLPTADRFLPPPPPSLSSPEWVADVAEIKAMGQDTSTQRTRRPDGDREVLDRQRDPPGQPPRPRHHRRPLPRAARHRAAGGDGHGDRRGRGNRRPQRQVPLPVLATRHRDRPHPRSRPTGSGPSRASDDGNPATVEQQGWRPLIVTPNHPEYPAAHGTITSSIDEVLTQFLGTTKIDIDIHGFDPNGAAGNLDAVHHFAKANDLRREIIGARLWAGLHYRFSSEAGIDLGRSVAKYDLKHAFQPVR